MIDVGKTMQLLTFAAGVGVVDGAIGAGIATAVVGSAAALSTFAIVGGVSCLLAGGTYIMCMASGEASRREEEMMHA